MTGPPNNDSFDEIARGVEAALYLSFNKLLQTGYSRDEAKALLLDLTRDVLNML